MTTEVDYVKKLNQFCADRGNLTAAFKHNTRSKYGNVGNREHWIDLTVRVSNSNATAKKEVSGWCDTQKEAYQTAAKQMCERLEAIEQQKQNQKKKQENEQEEKKQEETQKSQDNMNKEEKEQDEKEPDEIVVANENDDGENLVFDLADEFEKKRHPVLQKKVPKVASVLLKQSIELQPWQQTCKILYVDRVLELLNGFSFGGNGSCVVVQGEKLVKQLEKFRGTSPVVFISTRFDYTKYNENTHSLFDGVYLKKAMKNRVCFNITVEQTVDEFSKQVQGFVGKTKQNDYVKFVELEHNFIFGDGTMHKFSRDMEIFPPGTIVSFCIVNVYGK